MRECKFATLNSQICENVETLDIRIIKPSLEFDYVKPFLLALLQLTTIQMQQISKLSLNSF